MATTGVAFPGDGPSSPRAPQASGHAVELSPADSRASGHANSVRGRQIARTIAENACRRNVKADAADALSPGSSRSHGPLGQPSLTSTQGKSPIQVIYEGCEHLKCKTCGVKVGSPSPTPDYDKVELCGLVQWRSYTSTAGHNSDGSLTTSKKPEGNFCSLCNSVFGELGWKDSYTSISLYSKKLPA